MEKEQCKEKEFIGVITALVTPFIDGNIDFRSLGCVLQHQVEGGVKAFVINGTTGESPTLTKDEVIKLYQFVRKELGEKFRLIVGTGTNSTSQSVVLSRQAQDLGADAVLVVTPYYNKPTQAGLLAHFSCVAKSIEIPMLLYNVPSRTVVSISLETVTALSQISNVIGIKEASGDLEFGRKILESCGKSFIVTSGDDVTSLDLTSIGGHGVISVISHLIPKQLVQMIDQSKYNLAEAKKNLEKYLPLIEAVYAESNPIGIKMALFHLGLIASPELRLPLKAMSSSCEGVLLNQMRNLGWIQ